ALIGPSLELLRWRETQPSAGNPSRTPQNNLFYRLRPEDCLLGLENSDDREARGVEHRQERMPASSQRHRRGRVSGQPRGPQVRLELLLVGGRKVSHIVYLLQLGSKRRQ